MTQKRINLRRSTIVPTAVMSPYWREPLDLVAADLSPGGMYLISDSFPTIGEFVFCSFALSGDTPEYRMLSRVKRLNFHRRKTDRIRPGFGVEFLGVDADSHGVLAAALRGLPPPIPSRRREGPFAETGIYGVTPSLSTATALPQIPLRPKVVIPRPSWDYEID